MNYEIKENGIEIEGKEDFNPQHILECGQIFSYIKEDGNYVVFSADKKAKILENENGFFIVTENPSYYVDFFDLKTNYGEIKKKLEKFEIMKRSIEYGYGIRILKQDLFETLISFIVSANNNIKRIQMILNRIRERYGDNKGDYYAFPTRNQLLKATEQDFAELGAGYRAKYLYTVLRQINEDELTSWQVLETSELRNKLISLCGVGPKVADCVLLFGFGRGDVFPVDTWIYQMYNKFYSNLENREKIRQNLVKEFGLFSGYAQQYLFFFMRAGEI